MSLTTLPPWAKEAVPQPPELTTGTLTAVRDNIEDDIIKVKAEIHDLSARLAARIKLHGKLYAQHLAAKYSNLLAGVEPEDVKQNT